MFGRQPMLPIDQLLVNMEKNCNEDHVQEQSDLIRRTQAIAKESLLRKEQRDLEDLVIATLGTLLTKQRPLTAELHRSYSDYSSKVVMLKSSVAVLYRCKQSPSHRIARR